MTYTTNCRTCNKEVSNEAKTCPHCGQPEPDPSCFPSSAKILTPTGWKRIDTVEIGDKIISYSQSANNLRIQSVTKRIDHNMPSLLWEIQTEASNSVYTTAIHPFLTTNGWIRTHNLKTGDSLLEVKNSQISNTKITKIAETSRSEPVHNLYTAEDHNFVVDGFIVHNFAYFLHIRTWWHRLFVDPLNHAKTKTIFDIRTAAS